MSLPQCTDIHDYNSTFPIISPQLPFLISPAPVLFTRPARPRVHSLRPPLGSRLVRGGRGLSHRGLRGVNRSRGTGSSRRFSLGQRPPRTDVTPGVGGVSNNTPSYGYTEQKGGEHLTGELGDFGRADPGLEGVMGVTMGDPPGVSSPFGCVPSLDLSSLVLPSPVLYLNVSHPSYVPGQVPRHPVTMYRPTMVVPSLDAYPKLFNVSSLRLPTSE